MVTDVAGFAAAVWHRGDRRGPRRDVVAGDGRCRHRRQDRRSTCPRARTSSGRSGNRTGCICDTDALDTLPPRERRSGDGEMAKYHFLTGDDLEAMSLDERVARCVEIKAAFVAADEREGHRPGRAQLRAHARPRLGDRHAATRHARRGGRHRARLRRRAGCRARTHRRAVGSPPIVPSSAGLYGLPTTIPDGVDDDQLLELMARDKKARDGLTFVLDGPRGVEVVAPIDPGRRPRRPGGRALSRLGTVDSVQRAPSPRRTSPGASAPVRAALDGRTMVLSHATNIRWLTGFGGSLAWVVLDGDRLVLVTDGRYARSGRRRPRRQWPRRHSRSASSWRCARSARS